MTKRSYSWDELMASHSYAQAHHAAGYDLHGGLMADGAYVSPRVLNRWPAVEAWRADLAAKGWPLVDASQELMQGNFPNLDQERLLISHGYGEFLWNGLTITGVIEARGRALCDFEAPDFQTIIVDDIAETCTGHLHKGLLFAHGLDEGGDKDRPEIGAHDKMWFAVRDMLFGADAYPLPEVPESLARPDQGRLMPQLPAGFEQLITLLMNVLMIEVKAENFFSFCCAVMRDPALFRDRPEAAELAAQMVERIRTDEQIHVAYLQLALSEMRSFTFKTVDGGTVSGADLIDPVWHDMVIWHTVTDREFNRAQTREQIRQRLARDPGGEDLYKAFEAFDSVREAA